MEFKGLYSSFKVFQPIAGLPMDVRGIDGGDET
jgi:hypothetical protein